MQHMHQHLRRRSLKPRHPYPSHIFRIAVLDVIVYIVSVVTPLMTFPQVWEIYTTHNASGVSVITWGAYTVLIIPWILYGVVHREKAIVINSVLWLFFNLLVLYGALVY